MVVLNKWTTCDVLKLAIQTHKGASKEGIRLSTQDKAISDTLHLTSAGQTRRRERGEWRERGGPGQEGEEEIESEERRRLDSLKSSDWSLGRWGRLESRRASEEKGGGRVEGEEEECEQESIMASSKLTLFSPASWTQYTDTLP